MYFTMSWKSSHTYVERCCSCVDTSSHMFVWKIVHRGEKKKRSDSYWCKDNTHPYKSTSITCYPGIVTGIFSQMMPTVQTCWSTKVCKCCSHIIHNAEKVRNLVFVHFQVMYKVIVRKSFAYWHLFFTNHITMYKSEGETFYGIRR